MACGGHSETEEEEVAEWWESDAAQSGLDATFSGWVFEELCCWDAEDLLFGEEVGEEVDELEESEIVDVFVAGVACFGVPGDLLLLYIGSETALGSCVRIECGFGMTMCSMTVLETVLLETARRDFCSLLTDDLPVRWWWSLWWSSIMAAPLTSNIFFFPSTSPSPAADFSLDSEASPP